jgi:Glycosyl transferase family 2
MPPRRPPLPRISVVVPSLNQGHFLNEALDSIFRQEYPDLEVVVMDGGSTDQSVEIIRSYASRLKHWQSGPDGGQAAAINAGVQHCSGEIVAWLNSDDYYWGDALWSVGQAYVQHPGYGLYVGNGLRLDQATGVFTPFCNRHIAFDRDALVHGTDFVLQPSAFHLRDAWNKVKGLDPKLSFCMDWDLYIRIARDYPVVCLQEHLSVTREYHETKTRSGKMKRAAEIVRMIQAHTDTEVTPGSLLFMFETLLAVTAEGMPPGLRDHLRGAQTTLSRDLAKRYGGGGHGFPEFSDPQDAVFLPFAESEGGRPHDDGGSLPTISVLVLKSPDRSDLDETRASIENQAYPNSQVSVLDVGPNPVETIKKGIADTQGEIVGWFAPGDLAAAGAFREVGRAFAEDPELEIVFGNAVLIDRNGEMRLTEHGRFFSGLCIGTYEGPADSIPYGTEIYAIPQSTVFFRRRVLDRCGGHDVSFRHIYDYELLRRLLLLQVKTKKIERIQALVRVEPDIRFRRWNDILVELYRFSRPRWPGLFRPSFPLTLFKFVHRFVRRRAVGGPRDLRFWLRGVLVAVAATFRFGNLERWWVRDSSRTLDEASPFRLPPPLIRAKQTPNVLPSAQSKMKDVRRSGVNATIPKVAEPELVEKLRAS